MEEVWAQNVEVSLKWKCLHSPKTSGGTVEVVSEKEVVKVGTEVNSGKDGIHPIIFY